MALVDQTFSSVFIPGLKRSVSRIGFGCEPLGGFNWGKVDVSEIQEAICKAIDGIEADKAIIFDTSDTYGPFLSEERLGEALIGRTEKAVISTKFGVRLDNGKVCYDNSASYADQALDSSLERLKIDAIDIYQLHWPDEKTRLTDILTVLEKFCEEGRIKTYGVCNIAPEKISPLISDFPSLASFSNSHSLIDRKNAEKIRALCDRGMVFIAYGCLAQGLLTGKYNLKTYFGDNDRRSLERYKKFHGENFLRNLEVVNYLKNKAEILDCSISALALKFVLADLEGAIALAGIKSAEQWFQNSQAVRSPLSSELYSDLLDFSNEALS